MPEPPTPYRLIPHRPTPPAVARYGASPLPSSAVRGRPHARPSRRHGRSLVAFAIVGVVLALTAGGFYIYRVATAPDRAAPEAIVEQFLEAVFVQNNSDQLAPLLCSTWEPRRAMTWVTSQVDPRARMSWAEIVVVQADRERVNVLAELGYQFPGDAQPSAHRQWRFRLFNEDGWRVCDARPFTG